VPRKRRPDPSIPPALLEQVEADLIHDEALRLVPYRDTKGKLTVGVGYNLDDRGVEFLETVLGRPVTIVEGRQLLTRDEALKVLRADIDRVWRGTRSRLACFEQLSDVRKRVVLNMAFNLGWRVLQFRRAIAALEAGNYTLTALEMMASLWATQVGDGPGQRFDRAERLAFMMRTNKDWTAAA
jgi:lysozyme